MKRLGLILGGKDTTFIGLADTCNIGQTHLKTTISNLRPQSVFSLIAKSKNSHSKLQF